VVQEKPRRVKVETSYGNPKTKVIMDSNCKNKGQTMNFSKKRCLSGLHNSNSGLKRELV